MRFSPGRPRLDDSAAVVRARKRAKPLAPGEAAIIADVRSRLNPRGASKRLAHDLGISRSHLLSIANGNSRVGPKVAARLGYQPAWEKALLNDIQLEDQRLAEKIEAELARPSMLKERQ